MAAAVPSSVAKTLNPSEICLVTFNPLVAEHFAVFAVTLAERGHKVHILSGSKAYDVFKQFRDKEFFAKCAVALENELQINVDITKSTLESDFFGWEAIRRLNHMRIEKLITDIGDDVVNHIQQNVKTRLPNVVRYAYYDRHDDKHPNTIFASYARRILPITDVALFANSYNVVRGVCDETNTPIKVPANQPYYGLGVSEPDSNWKEFLVTAIESHGAQKAVSAVASQNEVAAAPISKQDREFRFLVCGSVLVMSWVALLGVTFFSGKAQK